MWRVIQGAEKAEFIREYQENAYAYDDIAVISITGRLKAMRIDDISVNEFASDDIVILVQMD